MKPCAHFLPCFIYLRSFQFIGRVGPGRAVVVLCCKARDPYRARAYRIIRAKHRFDLGESGDFVVHVEAERTDMLDVIGCVEYHLSIICTPSTTKQARKMVSATTSPTAVPPTSIIRANEVLIPTAAMAVSSAQRLSCSAR